VDLKMQIMKNIAILASGSGTNAENIARFFGEGNKIRVALVITNRKKAGVIGVWKGSA
jgi:phosphoribosylglycinamide formyltransferase-1